MGSANRLVLSLHSGKSLNLVTTRFECPSLGVKQVAMRGQHSCGENIGTFVWSTSAIAMVYFLVRSRQWAACQTESSFLLSSEDEELTLSLHYLISKPPEWIKGIFGLDRRGQSIVRYLFKMTNPEGKRDGPSTFSLNTSRLKPTEIQVIFDDKELCDIASLGQLAIALKDLWLLQKGIGRPSSITIDTNKDVGSKSAVLSCLESNGSFAKHLDDIGPTMDFELDWLNLVSELQAGCSHSVYGMLPYNRPAVTSFLKEIRGSIYLLTNKHLVQKGTSVKRLVVIGDPSCQQFDAAVVHGLVLEGLHTSVRLVWENTLSKVLPKGIDTFSTYDDEFVELADISQTGKTCVVASYAHLREYQGLHQVIWDDPKLSQGLVPFISKHPYRDAMREQAEIWVRNLEMLEHTPLIRKLFRR